MGLHDIQKPAPHVASYADLLRVVAHLGRLVQDMGERIEVLEVARSVQHRVAVPPAGASISKVVAVACYSGKTTIPAHRIAEIVLDVARRNGVAAADILGQHRLAVIVAARQEVFLRAREAGYSLSAIGRAMGRDHTTVSHGVAAALRRREVAA